MILLPRKRGKREKDEQGRSERGRRSVESHEAQSGRRLLEERRGRGERNRPSLYFLRTCQRGGKKEGWTSRRKKDK